MVIHVVKQGESLYGIGRTYGVNYRRVAKDNELPADAALATGQTIVVDTGDSVKRGMIEVNGYAFPNITDIVLEKTLPHLTYLSVFGCEAAADGQLKTIDDGRCLAACKSHSVLPVLVVTNLDGERGFSADTAHGIIADTGVQTVFIENTLTRLKDSGYSGIDIDFENIRPEDKEGFSDFLARLTDTMHNHGYFVSSQLSPRTKALGRGFGQSAHDYAAHGKTVDYVTVMGYERGGGLGAPGPVAPMPECNAGLDYAVSHMESSMILMGIPNYGYDWALSQEDDHSAKTLGNYQAASLACEVGARINYDKTAKSPFFEYRDRKGVLHNVWFEDARSIRAKLNTPFHRNIGGASLWTVNWYFPQCWLVLSGMYDVMKG